MSNRQARRQQSRQARRQSGSYRGGRSRGSSQGSGGGGAGGGGGGGRGANFLSWPFLAGVSILAAALLAVVIVLALRGGDDGDDGATGDLAILNQELQNLPTELQSGHKLGSDDAPAKLIQYEDFRCHFCLTYTLNHEGYLVEEFVKKGLLQIEFRHYPVLGDASVRAAMAATCAADQDGLFEYANRLFAIQVTQGTDSDLYETEGLVALAGEVGLDTAAFSACLVSEDTLIKVEGDVAQARAIGFTGTPSFSLNGLPVQNWPQTNEGWRELIQGAIDDATAEDDEAEGGGESGDADDDGS